MNYQKIDTAIDREFLRLQQKYLAEYLTHKDTLQEAQQEASWTVDASKYIMKGDDCGYGKAMREAATRYLVRLATERAEKELA